MSEMNHTRAKRGFSRKIPVPVSKATAAAACAYVYT